MATAVANRYASAVADLVLEDVRHDPERIAEQMRSFENALASSAELRGVLANPAVTPAKKRALVGRLAEMAGAGSLVRNLLFVLIDRRRVGFMREIRETFEEIVDDRLGMARAKVTSAGELAGVERQALERELSRAAGRTVRCQYAVDAELLGGAVVQVGSTVYDGSLRGRLDALRHKLME